MTNGTNNSAGNLTNTSNRPATQSNYATLPPSITTAGTASANNNSSYIDTRDLSRTTAPPESMNMTAPGSRTTVLTPEDKLLRRNSDKLGFATERTSPNGAYINTSMLNRPASTGPGSNGSSYIDTRSLSDRPASPAPSSGPQSQNGSYIDLSNLSRGSHGNTGTNSGNNANYVDTNNLSNKNSNYADTSSMSKSGSYVDTSSIKGNASGAQPGYIDTMLLKDNKDSKDKKDKKDKSPRKNK